MGLGSCRASIGFLVRGARHDLGIAHAGQIQGVNGVVLLDQRDDVAEMLRLGADGVQQDQGSAAAPGEVAQPALPQVVA